MRALYSYGTCASIRSHKLGHEKKILFMFVKKKENKQKSKAKIETKKTCLAFVKGKMKEFMVHNLASMCGCLCNTEHSMSTQ